jgi:DNA-binding response OmpR family regulator
MSLPTLLVVRSGLTSRTIPFEKLAETFSVESVPSEGALRAIGASLPAVVMSDSQCGDGEAVDLCRVLHAHWQVPYIVACDRCNEPDRVRGFQLGVDDYFCGPLSALEVRERVLAVLRRSARTPPAILHTYSGKHLVADFEGVVIRVDGIAVDLTRREFDLLRYLIEHRGRCMSRQELLDGAWRTVKVKDRRTVDTHIRRLRAKLGVVSRQIQTLPGRGYRFIEQALIVALTVPFYPLQG